MAQNKFVFELGSEKVFPMCINLLIMGFDGVRKFMNGYLYGQVFSLSHNSITDIRQIETLFSKMIHKLNTRDILTISLKQKNILMRPYMIFLIVMNASLIILILCQDYNLFLDN